MRTPKPATPVRVTKKVRSGEGRVAGQPGCKLCCFICAFLLLSTSVHAQAQFGGKITDAKGVPLPGATIAVAGGNEFAVADSSGQFNIMAAGGAIIEVSHVGYTTLAYALKDEPYVIIPLTEAPMMLQEVVVAVGYGTAQRKDITGAVASVSQEDFIRGNVTGALQQVQGNDIRKKMFLVGQQYVNQIEDEEHLQYDDFGNLLIFDPVITSFSVSPPKTQTAGARCAKWEFNSTGWNMSNDYAVYRLADIILMKAEAQLRSGDVAGALVTINQKFGGVSIRSRTGLPDFSAAEMTLDSLLAERARELSWEGHRHNDLIRFGHFTDPRVPEKEVSESYRTLFPIPKAELDKNSYLKQNPGYND